MRARCDLFNVVGLVIAGLLWAAILNNILNVQKHVFVLLFIALLSFLIGGGALINLVSRELLHGSTKAMNIGYCLSVAFLPLALWGMMLMMKHGQKRHKRHYRHRPYNPPPSSF